MTVAAAVVGERRARHRPSYGRFMARGQGGTQPELRRRGLSRKPCKVAGCETRASWHGLCEEHYPPGRVCSVEGCERNHYARGLCAMHYRRAARGQDLGGPELRLNVRPIGECSRPGCTRDGVFYGLCTRHRYARIGDALDNPLPLSAA